MTSNDGSNGNAEHGVERTKVSVLTVIYNHETCQVSFGAMGVPIALAQMMLYEAQTQLEFTRRQAAALALQDSLKNAAASQAIIDRLTKGR